MSVPLFEDLPDEPELSFIVLERGFREECDTALRNHSDHEDLRVIYARYISDVIASVRALELPLSTSHSVPDLSQISYESFSAFGFIVSSYVREIRIRHGRRKSSLSVRFDQKNKDKIQNYLTKIREVVNTLELTDLKRDALQSKLEALSTEVNRDKTSLEKYLDVSLAIAGVAEQVGDKIGPIHKFMDSIGAIFSSARDMVRDTFSLPKREPPKELEGPKDVFAQQQQKKQTNFARDLDDEVPF